MTRTSNAVIALRAMLQNNKVFAVVLLAVAIVAAVTLTIYFVRDDGDGGLLWNGDEAYLFISLVPRGLHVRYLGYPWMVLEQSLYAAPSPDDERISVTVIRVTESSVESHIVDVADTGPGSGPDFLTPINGHIYANYPALGGLSRWADDRFVAATDEERKRLGNMDHLTVLNIDNVNGWSKRGITPVPGIQFTVVVGNKFSLLVKNEATDPKEYPRISIDLLRPGRAPERLWYLDQTPHRVSRSVYQRTFEAPR